MGVFESSCPRPPGRGYIRGTRRTQQAAPTTQRQQAAAGHGDSRPIADGI